MFHLAKSSPGEGKSVDVAFESWRVVSVYQHQLDPLFLKIVGRIHTVDPGKEFSFEHFVY